MASRQREWQKKMIREGRCQICGKPRKNYAALCDYHAKKNRERARSKGKHNPWSKGKHNPWSKGGKGRPVIMGDEECLLR